MGSPQKNMAIFLYQAVLGLVSAVGRAASFFAGSSSLRERLGIYSAEDRQKLAVGYNIWLHAASAGEVNAISPFCQALRKAKPEARIILTTTSRTGKKIAQEKGVADAVFLAPLDAGGPLKRAFGAFRPVLILIAETEIWPSWLLRSGRNGVPVLLVNGRISDKSFPSYRRWKSLFSPALNCFTACLVQTKLDQERLEALGVSGNRIKIAGQMKYDIPTPDKGAVEAFRKRIGLGEKDVLFTLGSLREGEDDLLLPLVPQVLKYSPDIKVLVAPRHLKNAEVYREKLAKAGQGSDLRSALEKGPGKERVVVLDTLGELSLAYALSRAAFVGGTLVPVGGHNVMEPALCTVPVCYGPHTQNVAEAAEALSRSGGGFPVKEASEVPELFQGFLDRGLALETGRRAFDAVASMRGATDRTVKDVLKHWSIG